MRTITLGSTGIVTPQNAFGALPIQRISEQDAVALLRHAFEGGMTFFDTARAYSNSEERVGLAFEGMRDKVAIATKTQARTPEAFWEDLETSLRLLRTDHVDLYQFHCVDQCYRPGDGTGMYKCMLKAKEQGHHPGEFAAGGFQLPGRSLLGDLAVFEDDHLVGGFDRTHAVRDHDDRFAC